MTQSKSRGIYHYGEKYLHKQITKLLSKTQKALDSHNFDIAIIFLYMAAKSLSNFMIGYRNDAIEKLIGAIAVQLTHRKENKTGSSFAAYINNFIGEKIILFVFTKIEGQGGHYSYAKNLVHQLKKNSLFKSTPRFVFLLSDQPKEITPNHHFSDLGDIINLNQFSNSSISKFDYIKQIQKLNLFHTYFFIEPDDILSAIAFHLYQHPSTFINHSDHLYWCGINMSDTIWEMRKEGAYISKHYRATQNKNIVIHPIPVLSSKYSEVKYRTTSGELKGSGSDRFICTVVSNGHKLRSSENYNFWNLLQKIVCHANNIFVQIIGEHNSIEFRNFHAKYPQKIHYIGIVHSDLYEYYSRTDVFLDGYPESSTTSLLEFLKFGKPFITMSIPNAEILGSTDPRLQCKDFRTESPEIYLQKFINIYSEYDKYVSLAEKVLDNFLEKLNVPPKLFADDIVNHQDEHKICEILLERENFSRKAHIRLMLATINRMNIGRTDKVKYVTKFLSS